MTVATIVVPMIPTIRSPRKRIARMANVKRIPKTATKIGQVVKLPSWTGVPFAGMDATMPELKRPMKAMNRPMPIAIAFFSSSGIALKISSRSPLTASTTIATPSSTTSPIASGKLALPLATRPYATTAFRPRPGAIAYA